MIFLTIFAHNLSFFSLTNFSQIVHEEIYFALRAYEIDVSWFYLEFIIPLEEETVDKLA